MELGLGHLGMTPDAFWRLTMPEFNAKLQGFKEFHGVKDKEEAPTVEDIQGMLAAFPDGPLPKERRLRFKREKRDKDIDPKWIG